MKSMQSAPSMKALTLHQPWAQLMELGIKTIETRSWPTKYRGPLAIHAGLREMDEFGWELYSRFGLKYVQNGVILAVVDLIDCKPVEDVRGWSRSKKRNRGCMELEYDLGNYSDGRFAWITNNLRPLKNPVLASGLQRIWNLRGDALVLINRQLEGK